MDIVRWIIFILFGFLSIIPVIRLRQYKQTRKYKYLRHFVNAVFTWTIFIFLIHLLNELVFVYYISLLVYPLVFLVVYLGYETIQSFSGKKTHIVVRSFAYSFLMFLFVLSVTNDLHQSLQQITRSTITDRESILFADFGMVFLIHVLVSYGFIFALIVKLTLHLNKSKNTRENFIPHALLIALVIVGLMISIVDVFIYPFTIDPTYLFMVAFAYYLYWVVFTKDFQFQLLRGSRNELINAMREMYIIAEMNGDVVEYSDKLNDHFDLNEAITKNLNTFMRYLNRKAVLYRTFDHIKDEPYQDKHYLYTISKDFDIPGFGRGGILVLLYDETRLMKLVDQLNYALKYDTMTNLYNRNYFESIRDDSEKKHQECGVLISDLNGLKLYNDYFGHRAGDNLIKAYATILKQYEDKTTSVFRFGGDEFLLLQKKSTIDALKTIESSLLKELETTAFPNKISISTGIALRRNNENIDSLINRADKELYKQKDERSPAFQNAFLEWVNKK